MSELNVGIPVEPRAGLRFFGPSGAKHIQSEALPLQFGRFQRFITRFFGPDKTVGGLAHGPKGHENKAQALAWVTQNKRVQPCKGEIRMEILPDGWIGEVGFAALCRGNKVKKNTRERLRHK